jgi:hypothetical protein
MKYAFVIGSNAFVIPQNSICYQENGAETEFLRINSIYHDLPQKQTSFLEINLDIQDTDGSPITVRNNELHAGTDHTIKHDRDSVCILRANESLVFEAHQLDDDSAMSLEHNITAELEVNTPVAVIRITGDFKVGGLHISAENEKLFINNNGYGNSVLAGSNNLVFSPAGVVL